MARRPVQGMTPDEAFVFSERAAAGASLAHADGRLVTPVSAQEVLTNDSIVQKVQADLPESAIVAKIRSSQAKSDVRTETLIALKQAGVSDRVIEAMLCRMSPPGQAVANPGMGTPQAGNTRLLDRDLIYRLSGDPGVGLMAPAPQ